MSVSKETLELALQCVEGAAFTVAAKEMEELTARVAAARIELAEAIEQATKQIESTPSDGLIGIK